MKQYLATSGLLHGGIASLANGIPASDGQFNAGDLLVILRKAIGAVDY